MGLPDANGEFERGLEKPEVVVTHQEPLPERKVPTSTQCSSSSTERQSSDENKGSRTREEPFVCDVCSVSFKFKSELERHSLKHTDDRPFQCTKCTRSFKSERNLKAHYHIHAEDRLFQCTECTQRFKTKSSLNRHNRVHCDERPVQCTKCTRRFKTKNCLYSHNRVHSEERPFPCTKCNSSFKFKSNLDQHYVTHSDERSFECTECGASLKSKRYLKRHYDGPSECKPFSCAECGLSFGRECGLKKHYRTHSDERSHHATGDSSKSDQRIATDASGSSAGYSHQLHEPGGSDLPQKAGVCFDNSTTIWTQSCAVLQISDRSGAEHTPILDHAGTASLHPEGANRFYNSSMLGREHRLATHQRHMSDSRESRYDAAGCSQVAGGSGQHDQERIHGAQLHADLCQHDADAPINIDHRRTLINHPGDSGQFVSSSILGFPPYAHGRTSSQVPVDGSYGCSKTGADHRNPFVTQNRGRTELAEKTFVEYGALIRDPGCGFAQNQDRSTMRYQLQPHPDVSERGYENIPPPVNFNGQGSHYIEYEFGRFDAGPSPWSHPNAPPGSLNYR